jgi:hypothetical protein
MARAEIASSSDVSARPPALTVCHRRVAEPTAIERLMQHNACELTIADAATPTPPNITDPRVQVWRELDGRVCAYGYTKGGQHWMYLPGLASFYFGDGVNGVTAVPHNCARKELILDAYRRNVLPMVLYTRGQEVLHASAILTPSGVVALCAISGVGKSTMAFALSHHQDWPLWADDAVAFEPSGAEVTAIPLPFSIRLLPETAAFFARGSTAMDKMRPRVATDRGEALEQLAALLVLNRVREVEDDGVAAVRIRRVPSNQAFLDVLAHAYCFNLQDVERKRSMMRHYLDLVSRIPVFEVRFRAGLKMLPTVLEGIEQLVSNVECNAANSRDSAWRVPDAQR